MEPSLNSVLGVQKINFRQQDFIRDSNQICFPNPQCWDFGSKYLHTKYLPHQIFTHQIYILNLILPQSHASYSMNLNCIHFFLLASNLVIHLSLTFGILKNICTQSCEASLYKNLAINAIYELLGRQFDKFDNLPSTELT